MTSTVCCEQDLRIASPDEVALKELLYENRGSIATLVDSLLEGDILNKSPVYREAAARVTAAARAIYEAMI